ncbi:hypothetical protein [Tistrella sp.]|uniref:hypothetical protein n=1 Tax=Tistrella sp. TaxID=2024861 RepID=UPI0025CE897D|nr:hypothetical protein [Tistrella sp.]|tara:strand:- start:5169 stop:5882 length:714 start_codon:yes stop_codon:yes gene_type:complete
MMVTAWEADVKPFVVRIQLSSPVILGKRLALDGLLAALLFERTNDIDTAHQAIPLARWGSVWRGSAALIEGPAPIREVVVIQALKPQHELSPSNLLPGRRGFPRMDVASGPFRNQMSKYISYDTPAIWYTGCGDIPAVSGLLADVTNIGTKRTSGYGEVHSVDIEEIDFDRAGLTFVDGTPARAIPADEWATISNLEAEMAYEPIEPPYWRSPHVLCAVPAHSIVAYAAVRRLTGVD